MASLPDPDLWVPNHRNVVYLDPSANSDELVAVATEFEAELASSEAFVRRVGFSVLIQALGLDQDALYSTRSTTAYTDILGECRTCDVLVIADFGRESANLAEAMGLRSLLDSRLMAARPTIATTSIAESEMAARFPSDERAQGVIWRIWRNAIVVSPD